MIVYVSMSIFNFFKWKDILFKLNLVVVDILGFELLFEVNENVCKIIDIFNKLVELLKIFGLKKMWEICCIFF